MTVVMCVAVRCLCVTVVCCSQVFVCDCCDVCCSQVSVFEGTKGQCKRVSTSGVDGNIIIWDLPVSTVQHAQCR